MYWVGQYLPQATAGPFAHLVLAHPTGRLGSRLARSAVVVAYLAGLGLVAVSLLFRGSNPTCNCPGNPFFVVDAPEVAGTVLRFQQVCFIAVLLLVAWIMIRRWRAADRLRRRDLAWVYWPALAYGVISLADSASRSMVNAAGIPVPLDGTSGLRDALAGALDDPDLVVGIWDPLAAGYRDGDGPRRPSTGSCSTPRRPPRRTRSDGSASGNGRCWR